MDINISRKEKTAIMLCSDKNYLFALGAFIINIINKISEFDAIIVYYDGITEEEKIKIEKIDARIKFIKYTYEDLVNEFFVDNLDILRNENVKQNFKRYSHLHFAKIKAFQLLEEYAHVAYFDLDMLLTDDISDLFHKNEYNIIWKWDHVTIKDKITSAGFVKKFQFDDFDEYQKIKCPNGGLFIVNNNCDYKEAFNIGKNFMIRCLRYHPYCIDELTLGYISYKLNFNILGLDGKIYNVFPYLFNSSSKLLHFLTDFKPWKSEIVQYIYPEWVRNYTEFSRLTGYQKNDLKIYDNIGNFLFRQEREETWLSILDKVSFPPELLISYALQRDELVLKINYWQYFSIKRIWMFNLYKVQLVFIKNDYFADNFMEMMNFIKNKFPEIEMATTAYHWILSYSVHSMSGIQEKFEKLYAIANFINKNSGLSKLDNTRFGYLKTFFNKFITLNGLQLRQTEDKNLAGTFLVQQYENKMALNLKDTSLYIQDFSINGYVKLGATIQYFDCLDAERPAIKILNKYLSALNGAEGKFTLMPHCREWERFTFIENNV